MHGRNRTATVTCARPRAQPVVQSQLAIMRAFPFIMMFLALRFSATAGESPQPQSDAEIRQKIVGTWVIDYDDVKGTETYFADGRYTSVATLHFGHTIEVETLAGTWGVTNGILTAQVSTAARWKDYRVIRVDDQKLVMKWNTNKNGDLSYTTTQRRDDRASAE